MSGSFKQISERLLTSSNYEQVDEVEWDIQKLVKIHNKTEEENQELKRKLDLAVEALEFYKKEESWNSHGYDGQAAMIEGSDLCDNNTEGKPYFVEYIFDERPGGKRARKALKEIKGE